jgi:hypothetical protein
MKWKMRRYYALGGRQGFPFLFSKRAIILIIGKRVAWSDGNFFLHDVSTVMFKLYSSKHFCAIILGSRHGFTSGKVFIARISPFYFIFWVYWLFLSMVVFAFWTGARKRRLLFKVYCMVLFARYGGIETLHSPPIGVARPKQFKILILYSHN